MKPIQLGAEAVMLLMKVMQLNTEAKDRTYYTFGYSGGTNAFYVSKYYGHNQSKSLVFYIEDDFGCSLKKMFDYLEEELKQIRQGNGSDAGKEGRTDEEV